MKCAIFYGCKAPYYLEQYRSSTKILLKALAVNAIELKFTCCGYPYRDLDFESYIFSSAFNIALAENKGLTLMTPCKCCYGSLKHADHWLKTNGDLKAKINRLLSQEGLRYTGEVEIKHLLSYLADHVGLDEIQKKITRPLPHLTVAAHYGCHALRPSEIVQFDNPFSPSLFEKVIAVTGAQTVDWPRRLDCCGNPLWGKNNALSLALMRNKIVDAHASGAGCICTACTYCQIQFDSVQASERKHLQNTNPVPAILITQLLGMSMGLSERKIGLRQNHLQVNLEPSS